MWFDISTLFLNMINKITLTPYIFSAIYEEEKHCWHLHVQTVRVFFLIFQRLPFLKTLTRSLEEWVQNAAVFKTSHTQSKVVFDNLPQLATHIFEHHFLWKLLAYSNCSFHLSPRVASKKPPLPRITLGGDFVGFEHGQSSPALINMLFITPGHKQRKGNSSWRTF